MDVRSAPPGILCALITPFRDDQSVDLEPLAEVVDFMIDRGTHGLFVLGTTGEGPLLEAAERRLVAEFVVGHVSGKIPVVVHCGAPDTKTTADLARHAQEIGADGAAAVIPYYFRSSESDLFRHFEAVASAATGIPHYVYENPERVGYSAGVGLVARLVGEVPNILGVKDTGDTIGKVTDLLGQPVPIEVYVGNNSTVFPALVLGARGAVSAMANAVPELVTGVYDRWRERRAEEARRLQFALARLTASLAGVPFVGAVKHLMARRGLPTGLCRSPQALLTPEQAALVDRRIARVDDLQAWLEPLQAPARG